jgi:hypothetical protein
MISTMTEGDIAQKKEELDKIYMKVWTYNIE